MNNGNNLKKGSLGLWTVVFFVVAAASPLTGVVGAMPLNFMLGNGAGVPGSFIVAALLLIIFSFGFIAMSKYVVNVTLSRKPDEQEVLYRFVLDMADLSYSLIQ
ncbi:hypothetical protein [Acinetobacter baumannii]|uniref:hypothetical protein n=1 Tax=Acinetobacter baumannii TaxID=470 RepID=UPI001FFEF364|nr:hypothetical protein [Acinetobacter baumannii]